MSTIQQTSKQYFKSLQIIYWTMIAAQIMFVFVSFYMVQITEIDEGARELKEIFIYVVPLFIILSLIGAKVYFQKSMNTSRNESNLVRKMSGYRSTLIVRFALFEGPSLFSIIVFFVTGSWIFLGMASLMIIIFLLHKPTMEKAAIDLELNANERLKTEDPDAVIAEFKSK